MNNAVAVAVHIFDADETLSGLVKDRLADEQSPTCSVHFRCLGALDNAFFIRQSVLHPRRTHLGTFEPRRMQMGPPRIAN